MLRSTSNAGSFSCVLGRGKWLKSQPRSHELAAPNKGHRHCSAGQEGAPNKQQGLRPNITIGSKGKCKECEEHTKTWYIDYNGTKPQWFLCSGSCSLPLSPPFPPAQAPSLSCYHVAAPWFNYLKEPDIWNSAMGCLWQDCQGKLSACMREVCGGSQSGPLHYEGALVAAAESRVVGM